MSDTCAATLRVDATKHTHHCSDYANHSAGAHHCDDCGLLWRSEAQRCTLCRTSVGLEPTNLPGTGYRCTDHDACRQRVRDIVAAHVGLGEVCRG